MSPNVICCPVCTKFAHKQCGGCKSVAYCCREHQVAHWPTHKARCCPFKITTSEILGRYLVATRNIAEGELILTEKPLVVGPKASPKPVCVGCLRELDVGVVEYCGTCGWPVCDVQCSKAPIHARECKTYKRADYKATPIKSRGDKDPAYYPLTPLRCLLLPPEDLRKLNELQGHLEQRERTPLFHSYRKRIVPLLRDVLHVKQTEREILNVCAILDTNAFDVRGFGKKRGRAIYHRAAMLAHDCRPNTRHFFDSQSFVLSLYATRAVPKGDALTATYTQTLWPTFRRRAHLKAAKCFDCCCERCADPTEFGTYVGSIVCKECGGFLCSKNPLDPTAPWACNKNCGKEMSANQILWGAETLRSEMASLDAHPVSFEVFLDKYKSDLHPTNANVVEVKYALTQLYGSSGFPLDSLETKQIERKIQLCQELLSIAEKLDPGATRWRGQLLYALQEAIVVNAKNEYTCKNITKQRAQKEVAEAMRHLTEAVSILRLEPEFVDSIPEQLVNLQLLLATP